MARNSRTRQNRSTKPPATNAESFQILREWFLPDGMFSQMRLHGNIKWAPAYLVWLALCWSWSESRCLTDAFTEALGWCQQMFGSAPLNTYQGLMGALVKWTPKFMPVLRKTLHQRMEQMGGAFWRIDGWVPIAFDGSRSTAPRTSANEAAFCAANYGKGSTAKYRKKKSKGMRRKKNEKNKAQPQKPQAWITLMWHMGLRLPWSWRLGPSNASERTHVMEMARAEEFPENTLFCGDAGFVGYPLWASLLERGSDFLVRVGANVNLLHEQAECDIDIDKVGRDIRVICWPKAAQDANRPPLQLRLVQVDLGKIKVWILTSVLEWQRLSPKAIVRFYKMRWGIEVEFRGLKQTLDRAKLRCRNDKRLLVELDWSILAMAVAELFALKEQLAERPAKSGHRSLPADPAKRSLAQTMRALRTCLRNLNGVPEPGQDLQSRLREALTDGYVRKRPKGARYRPANPDKKPLGDPKLRPLTEQEEQKLQEIAA